MRYLSNILPPTGQKVGGQKKLQVGESESGGNPHFQNRGAAPADADNIP